MWKNNLARNVGYLFKKQQTPEKLLSRNLNLLEFQSKEILAGCGVAVQKFVVVKDKSEIGSTVKNFNVDEYVVKAQVMAGGRGKGHFDTGFQSGVHVLKEQNKVPDIVNSMLGNRLITKQTPTEGVPVRSVMIAESVDIFEEKYLCFVLDRESGGPVCIASPDGGVDIEEVAEKTPEKVKTVPIDIYEGLSKSTAMELAKFLKFDGATQEQAASEILKLYQVFTKYDLVQLEINPFAKTNKGVISVDAKLQVDENAKFRQLPIFENESTDESDPREVEATKHNLNYIQMDGNIGCLVNGAGLAMGTMDIIKLHGGNPANFLDVGGGASAQQVKEAFKIITSDPKVNAVMVNIFGGIMKCDVIAEGVIAAAKELNLKTPVIVRLQGTNVDAAKALIKSSGLKIHSSDNLDEAARLAVSMK